LKFAAYIRMSTEHQQDSPATQKALIEEWIQQNDHELTATYTDEAISASKPLEDRAQGSLMLAAAVSKKRPFDAIVCIATDRLFRNLQDELNTWELLHRHKCELWTIQGQVDRTDPRTEFMANVLAAAAEMERKVTGLRIRQHHEAAVMQGRSAGGYAPLGLTYDKDTKTYAPNERADDAVAVFGAYIDHHGNASKTARYLNTQGILSPRGKLWDCPMLLQVLRNKKYRQTIHFRDKQSFVPDLIPRIVPQELTDAVDELMSRYRRLSGRAKGSKHAYSGLMKCGICGANLHSWTQADSRYGPGNSQKWKCANKLKGICTSRTVAEKFIDALVGDAVSEALSLHRDSIAKKRESKPQTASTERKRERLLKERENWNLIFSKGRCSEEQWDKQITAIDKELSELSKTPPKPRTLTAEQLDRLSLLVVEGWGELSEDVRREVLLVIGAQITVYAEVGRRMTVELDSILHPEPIVKSAKNFSRRQMKKG
jgi:DNA invertase Pin-like site-specific DNA recombinase